MQILQVASQERSDEEMADHVGKVNEDFRNCRTTAVSPNYASLTVDLFTRSKTHIETLTILSVSFIVTYWSILRLSSRDHRLKRRHWYSNLRPQSDHQSYALTTELPCPTDLLPICQFK